MKPACVKRPSKAKAWRSPRRRIRTKLVQSVKLKSLSEKRLKSAQASSMTCGIKNSTCRT